jgi:GDP-L-fucose synthase
MKKNKILIAGSNGMVGSAIVRALKSSGYKNLLTPSRKELDYTNKEKVIRYFKIKKIDIVIIASAKVGGILANINYPVDFLETNLLIQNNLINTSYKFKIKKLIFLGSSCIYPLNNSKIKENDLMSGYVEPTNEPYAIAKIAGIKLCESYNKQFNCDFRSIIPCNLYGYGDNYNLKDSHVLPALIRKFYEANLKKKNVEVWGDGSSIREFMFVDDLANAIIKVLSLSKKEYGSLLKKNKISVLNIGTSKEISIKNLAYAIKEVVGFKGKILFNKKYPNGNPYKVLDCSIIFKIWKPKIKLKEGISLTFLDYIKNLKNLRK